MTQHRPNWRIRFDNPQTFELYQVAYSLLPSDKTMLDSNEFDYLFSTVIETVTRYLKDKGYDLNSELIKEIIVCISKVKVSYVGTNTDVTSIAYELIRLGLTEYLKFDFVCSVKITIQTGKDEVEVEETGIHIRFDPEYPERIYLKYVQPVIEILPFDSLMKRDPNFTTKAMKTIFEIRQEEEVS